jgi:hypothetical protein
MRCQLRMCIDHRLESVRRLAMAIFLHTFSGDGILGPAC